MTNPRRVATRRGAADMVTAIAGMLTFLDVLPVLVQAVKGWLQLLRPIP